MSDVFKAPVGYIFFRMIGVKLSSVTSSHTSALDMLVYKHHQEHKEDKMDTRIVHTHQDCKQTLGINTDTRIVMNIRIVRRHQECTLTPGIKTRHLYTRDAMILASFWQL